MEAGILKKCFEIDASGRLGSVEYPDVVAQWRSGGGPFWIDVESPDSGTRGRLLVDLGLDQKLVDQLLNPDHAARILPFDEGLFFEFPLQISGKPSDLKSISFVCLDRLVITLRGSSPDLSMWTDATVSSQITLNERSLSELVGALLVEWSIELRRSSSEIRKKTVVLSDRLDDDPEALTFEDIVDLKRDIRDLDTVSEERHVVMEELESFERPFFDLTQSAGKFKLALRNTSATARHVDRLVGRAGDLQSRYDSVQQEKTNHRLSRLTVISAIFLPLTLVVGIYGMNFINMPELGHPLGYPGALAGMGLIALGLLWWFRSRGWLH